ncbi:hypothetical protein [Psychromonas sp. Urea-02u-13]|uniref:hypothetical protein n=1 Tax=Psychromonas sp. Urea-02u-13 TaxID=2058326 RepID=UPI000C3352B6|nr:hypothetical protein [Psychromonas sp. Urea-02u-13]PKG40739.1 hypothetical protein CXF74_01835 [Psychromonas sp. Urea-02u-13]
MSNGDQLPLYSAVQLPELFARDVNSKFIALKVKQEGQNTALHAIYIAKQEESEMFPFCALVTVTEWQGKSEKEEFFIEAENAEQILEKLERFDEIHRFIFLQVPSSMSIETVTMEPQSVLCTLFPELGTFKPDAPEEVLFGLKNSSLALLRRLETQ